MTVDHPVRIGILGAAKISTNALFAPAADTEGVTLEAIAARDRERAETQAEANDIGNVFDRYADVLASPDVDAIYNPLPISLHKDWTIAALRAGKHVLCEKPFASNGDEARAMVDVADQTGLVLMEAFHWRYHPLAARIGELLDEGQLGTIERVAAGFQVPIPESDNVRQSYELSGGALMDLGCYPVQWVRFAANAEPTVTAARMVEGRPDVDVSTEIDLAFPSGVVGRVETAMTGDIQVAAWLEVTGADGVLRVDNPIAPHRGNRVTVRRGETTTVDEEVTGRTTYHHQLEAFRDAVTDGAPFPTGGADAVANMDVIDASYEAAGLSRRGTR